MPQKIIDLSNLLNEKMTVYPDTVGPKFEPLNTVAEHGFAEMQATMVLHTGTHIDAPCHILANTKSLSDFPIEKFIGSAIVIPCREIKEISLSYLQTFEKMIQEVDFVIFFTGWQFRWNTDAYFENCPSLTPEAAQWLVNFDLKGIGMDAFSVDPVVSAHVITDQTLPNHNIILGRDIILIENLTNLDQIPDGIFTFQCLPIHIENADGSPVRAIAIV